MSAPIFLDTVGLIAAWDRKDQWHESATAAYGRIKDEAAPTLSTSYIMLECGNAAARKPFREPVARLRLKLETAGQLIFPTEADWAQAWAAYERGEGANAGIVDQVSFVVMRRLGIARAFTNDGHFKAAGFEVLF